MEERRPSRAFLDRPAARLLALLVIILCGAFLAYLHRNDLRPLIGEGSSPGAIDTADDPASICMQQRFGEIDGMVDEGVIDAQQADLFKHRAEAMCRSTTGGDDSPPLSMPTQ
jgi:hypothetical protein